MTRVSSEQASRSRSIQVLLFLVSLVFFGVIAYGYFHLFIKFGYFPALLFSIIAASVAWYLARVIGTSEGGVRKHLHLFIPLLLISAAGVYNSMMLYVEGNRILADTVSDSQERFANLQAAADRGLAESGATERVNHIHGLREALFSEIRNPLNCGQGQEAKRLIAELQRTLPGFTPLSSVHQDCSRNEEVIQDYRRRTDELIGQSDWNNPTLNAVSAEAAKIRRSLEELRSSVSTSYAPALLQGTISSLENADASYRDLRYRMSRLVNVRDLPPGLHLSAAQSLGNVFKILPLFIERLNELSTYVYLAMAIGFDYLMVLLFQMAWSSPRRTTRQASLSGAWQ